MRMINEFLLGDHAARNAAMVALLVARFSEFIRATCEVVKLRSVGRHGPLHDVLLLSA